MQLASEQTVFALHGELGSGKTTFVQGMARALGITQPVTSPTYNLYHVYQAKAQLIHLDAYRLESPESADALCLEDCLIEPWYMAIEWPEKLPSSWLQQAWHLDLQHDPRTGHHHIQLA